MIEQAPVPDLHGERRGVVAEGPVGMRWLGRFRIFRYEIRRWREGRIPTSIRRSGAPSGSPMMSESPDEFATLPSIPTPVWGRDEFNAGEMWNSNSVVSWVLARSGASVETIHPPANGRAPGWDAGLAVAARGRN